MRVLTLSWEYPPRVVGGLARHVYELSSELARQDVEVTVLTCAADGESGVEPDGLRVVRVRMNNPSTLDFLTWVMQFNLNLLESALGLFACGERWDLVHAHDWLVAYAAKAIKHGLAIPLVATIHATEYGRNWGLHNDLQRYISDVEWWLCYEAWKVICCSSYMREELGRIFNLPSDKVEVIPNGVNRGNFELPHDLEALRAFRSNYAAPDEKMIFFIGRLVHEKGAHVLVEAMPKILAYNNKVKAVIAGKGPQEDYLRSTAKALGVYDRIYFTGYVDDATRNKLYLCADAACVPSLYEPFGIAALEAMAAGVPVVVSDVGGLSDIVRHGITGLKAYAGNPNSLADSLLTLLGTPDLAARLREAAKREVAEKYAWERIARDTIAVYTDVLEAYRESDWGQRSGQEVVAYESSDHGRWERYQTTASHV